MLARAIQSALGGGIHPPDLNQYGKAIVFDPQDLSTLFQNAAGTIPVTGVEQPVGLMLDKGQGLEFGPELIDLFAIMVSGSVAMSKTSTGVYTCSSPGGAANSTIRPALSSATSNFAGKALLLSVQFASVTGATAVKLYNGAEYKFGDKTLSSFDFITDVPGSVASMFLAFDGSQAFSCTMTISVREIKGHHATQSTAGSSPTLSGSASTPYLTLDGSADFAATATGGKSTAAFYYCASVKIGKINAAQTLISDTGTNTGYRVRINASNQLEFSAGNGSAYTTIATAGTALALNDTVVLSAWHDGENLNAQINDGTIYQAAFATATAGTDALTVGKDNGAASSYFGGNIYGMFNSGPVPNINLRNALKRHYAAKAGIRI